MSLYVGDGFSYTHIAPGRRVSLGRELMGSAFVLAVEVHGYDVANNHALDNIIELIISN
jgi:hypothetical protein